MVKVKELSQIERAKIVFMLEEGYTQSEIAKTMKCSRCAVQYTLNRHRIFNTFSSLPRTGRKKITGAREERFLVRTSLQNRKKTSKQLAEEMKTLCSVDISARTIRRRLGEKGLKGCKARKKPWLSEANRKKRLNWAKFHQDWSAQDWAKVVWSDESNIEVIQL